MSAITLDSVFGFGRARLSAVLARSIYIPIIGFVAIGAAQAADADSGGTVTTARY